MSVNSTLGLVTLGVKDVTRSTEFYQDLGLSFLPLISKPGKISFFRLNNGTLLLSLYPRESLKKDAYGESSEEIHADSNAFNGFTLGQTYSSPDEVDKAVAHAVKQGAVLVKPAEKVFWGGYSGYIRDFDGFLWEIAHNPFLVLTSEGMLDVSPK